MARHKRMCQFDENVAVNGFSAFNPMDLLNSRIDVSALGAVLEWIAAAQRRPWRHRFFWLRFGPSQTSPTHSTFQQLARLRLLPVPPAKARPG